MPTLKKSTANNIPYAILLPDGFDPAQRYPIGVFMHGLGEKGPTPKMTLDSMLNTWGPFKALLAGTVKSNIIWIARQMNTGQWSYDLIEPIINQTLKDYAINEGMLYLTGLSLGGGGCSFVLNDESDLFAAAVALSPSRGTATGIAAKTTAALWYKHNMNDTVVSPSYSINTMAQYFGVNPKTMLACKPKGLYTTHDGVNWLPGNIPGGLTLNETGGHGGWQDVYNDQDMYDWMVLHSKGKIPKKAQVNSVDINAEAFDYGTYTLPIGDNQGSINFTIK